MSDIDRIAEVLGRHIKWWSVQSAVATCAGSGCGWSKFGTATQTTKAHDKHLATEIAEALHPVIETMEELDALPVDTIVMDDMADVLQLSDPIGGWRMVGYEGLHLPILPCRVLWTPEES